MARTHVHTPYWIANRLSDAQWGILLNIVEAHEVGRYFSPEYEWNVKPATIAALRKRGLVNEQDYTPTGLGIKVSYALG